MKELIIYILTISLLLCKVACFAGLEESLELNRGIKPFPEHEEVLVYLDKNIKSGCNDCEFKVAKKPAGYFLQIHSIDSKPVLLSEIIIWDVKKRKYRKLNVKEFLIPIEKYELGGISEKLRQEFIDEKGYNGISRLRDNIGQYKLHLFFGYAEWYQDVIDYLEESPNLSLNSLENLARAYDYKAGYYLNPGKWGNKPNFAKEIKQGNYEPIEQWRVDIFLKSAGKSLYYYSEIIKLNPNYLTFLIGDVELKKANNLVNYYHILSLVHRDELAKAFLNKVEYPKGFIDIAKRYLDGCSDNSVLITNGDTDTYPLWYVQEYLGYRKDVVVLNASLMSLPRYITMNKIKHGLNMQVSISNFFNNEIGFLLFENSTDTAQTTFEKFTNEINLFVSKKHITFYDKISTGTDFLLDYNQGKLQVKLEKEAYYLSDIALLDLIQNNQGRKFFFASRAYFSYYGFKNNFFHRLLITELTVDQNDNPFDELSEKLMDDYIRNFDPKLVNSIGNMEANILMNFYNYTEALSLENPDKSKKLIELIDSKLPDSLYYNDNDLTMLNLKYYLKRVLDNDKKGLFKNNFNNIAIERLNKLAITKYNLKESLTFLDGIYSVYQTLAFAMAKNEERKPSDSYKEIIQLLVEKIDKVEKKGILDNFKWTKQKYLELRKKASLYTSL